MLVLDAMMMIIVCSVAVHRTEQADLHASEKYEDTGKQCCESHLINA